MTKPRAPTTSMLQSPLVFACLLCLAISNLASARRSSTPAFVRPSSSLRQSNQVATPSAFVTSKHTATTRLYLERPSNSTFMESPTQRKKPASSTELDASMSGVVEFSSAYKVYCDLDGVLVDFEHGVRELLNSPPSQLVKGTMWKHIARANAFYEDLPWTKDGKRLWNAIRHLRPDILTGVPYPKASRQQKYNWCKRELGVEELHHVDMAAGCRDHEPVNGNVPKTSGGVTNIITCWSNNKHMECSSHRSILIDDRDSLREPWESAGGIFVHHVNAESTIQKLREHGVLMDEDNLQ